MLKQYNYSLERQSQQRSSAFVVCWNVSEALIKQCRSRSDCSCRSSLIWSHTVCLSTSVKPVISGHSKIDKTNILKPCGSSMQVKSIAECSPWSILQYFWPALSHNWSWKAIFSLWEWPLKTGFTVQQSIMIVNICNRRLEQISLFCWHFKKFLQSQGFVPSD